MEVAVSGPTESLSGPRRRATTPLRQLVEESRRASVHNHLLESKIYARLRSNGLIQAEPPALHFSGFELGKDYHKVLKLINISSEVINIHIIGTQTKYFKTTYTKKYRLIPGLAYAVKVQFQPDEWRYFYDCIRVHCKGEENVLVPVHAYPVIDDLNIPSHVDLPAVPLGRSVVHLIPLSCSCPVDFEFQVHVVQPHRAFSVQPLAGVIPARGQVEITVIFSPLQYETCEITLQLLVSQFNTKPYLCTVAGRSAPHLATSKLESRPGQGDAAVSASSPAPQVPPLVPNKRRSTRKAGTLKAVRDQAAGPKPPVDVSTPAGVAKMLIKSTHKLTSRDLREAMTCGLTADMQNRQVKEALFMKRVQQDSQEERANHLRWHVRLGKDPVAEETKRLVLEEREMALHEYRVKKGDLRDEVHLDKTKLSTRRVLCEAGQEPAGTPPPFHFYGSGLLQVRHRALRQFQQAARRVTVRCRMSRRLASLKRLAVNMKKLPTAHTGGMGGEETSLPGVGGEETCHPKKKVSPDRVLPFSFPVFCHNDEDQPVPSNLRPVPVEPMDVTVKPNIPYFNLQVPQRYKQMGYQTVSTWEAYTSYIPTSLARPLRTGALDELLPEVTSGESLASAETKPETAEGQGEEEEEEGTKVEPEDHVTLSFSAQALLCQAAPANPLRIFNPAPGLRTYKLTPKYLESDLEYHLCPLPRYGVPEGSARRANTPNTQACSQKFLDRKEVINGIMTWRRCDSATLCLSTLTTITSDQALCRPVDDNTDVLPLAAPPPLLGLPDDLAELVVKPTEDPALQLTPEMIRAEFPWDKTRPANHSLNANMTAGCERGQMRKNVADKLKHLRTACRNSSLSPGEDCE